MAEQRKTRILAIFGNVAWMGQERANVFVLDLLQQTGRAECLLAVSDRGVQWHVQPHLEAAGLKYRKMRFCWNIRKTFNLRHWWLHLTDILRGNVEFYLIWRDYQPDVIHAGNAFQVMTLLPVLALIRTPLIFRLGDVPEQRCAAERWLWRRLAARVTRFVCNSRFVLGRLCQAVAVAGKARIIYNYPPERRAVQQSDPALPNARPELFTVVYLGQIAKIKGTDLLIEAAIEFCLSHTDSRLIIAGPLEPPQHQQLACELIKRVKDLGLSERILFTGTVEDVPGLLALGHVHVCPSVYEEPSANVIVEAKAAARLSIIFATGGSPELIEHGVDGYTCPGKSSADILAALEYYHARPDWGRAQGQAAHASLAKLGISRERFLAAWLEVYDLSPVATEKNTEVTESA